MKWYETAGADTTPIISCRVRLARNIKAYPFFIMLKDTDAKKMIEEIRDTMTDQPFKYTDIRQTSNVEKLSLLEHHKISLELLRSHAPGGLLSDNDDNIHIMLNEEDHIRIQSLASGKNIKKAYKEADKLDNILEKKLDYAFDENLGYLTSCPSNAGTGLRASYMVHLPMLEQTGRLSKIISQLSSFGMTIRGIYGENSEPVGSIYQISNQMTMGKSEEEIIGNLENITTQIVQAELDALELNIKKAPILFEDHIYRAYGILSNARQIGVKEARTMLSVLRLGVVSGILTDPIPSIYNMMMNIEYGILNKQGNLSDAQIDIERANYIREELINAR